MRELQTEFLFEMEGNYLERLDLGPTPHGRRIIVRIAEGRFNGPKLKGEVLPGGADWLLIRPDGAGEIDVRVTLRTDDGHFIYTYYRGFCNALPEVWQRRAQKPQDVDPFETYIRTALFFETSSEKYSWLNNLMAIGIGELKSTGVAYAVYSIR